MSRTATVLLAIAIVVGTAACDGARAELSAERVDISLNLLVDGSVEVRETFVVRASPATGARFERVIRKRHADALFDLTATIDGRPAPEGRGAGRVRVENGRPTKVRFEFDPTPNPTRTLTLQYRVAGVVALSGGRGHFEWEALAPRRRFDIAATRIELSLPDRTVQYGPAGVAEAGWTVSETARGIVSERRNLPRDQAATIVADISTTTLALAEPRWQFVDARAKEFMPAFLSGALFILVIGAGVVWIVRFQYPRSTAGADAAYGVAAATSPVLQVALAQRPRRQADGSLAALVDLGMRGRLEVREDAERHVAVLPGPARHAVLGHEQVLLDELWLQQSRTMPLRTLRGLLQRNGRAFARAIVDDLVSAGLADRDRIGVRKGLSAGGAAVLALAVVCFVIVGMLLGDYGPWPVAMPASILIVGIVLLIYGEAFSILTSEGVRQSFAVRQRLREMRRAGSTDGGAPAARAFAAGLPLAIAAGFGPRWQKQHETDLNDDRAFAWLTPAAGESRAALLARLLKPGG